MERILVTGGAGYIGSTLVPELLASGFEVTVLDNFMYGQLSLAQLCRHPAFFLERGDIRDDALVTRMLAKADYVIPLAALVGAPLCDRDPVGARTVNLEATLALISKLSSRQRVLMPTTNSAYGSGGPDHSCDETSPLRPISTYARHKVEVEQALLSHPNAISFRLATVFGMSPRMRLDLLVNDFTYRAARDRFLVLFEAHFKRNYVHVHDVARVFLHGISRFDQMKGQIYNVGLSDANLSKLELCQAIARVLPDFTYFEAPLSKDPDQRDYLVSNAKIESTGFSCSRSIENGVRELIKGFAMLRSSPYANV
jgi:nucleoside-diphosphate-sugar epimerase